MNKLNYQKKSRKALFALTMLTVISIASVVAVYAVILGQITSTGEVTIGGMAATSKVTYSSDNVEGGTWADELTLGSTSDSWYCRLEIPEGSYSGPVTITWKLQNKTGTGFVDVAGKTFVSDTIVLDGHEADVYATATGVYDSANHNWGNDDFAGTFKVLAYIESA